MTESQHQTLDTLARGKVRSEWRIIIVYDHGGMRDVWCEFFDSEEKAKARMNQINENTKFPKMTAGEITQIER